MVDFKKFFQKKTEDAETGAAKYTASITTFGNLLANFKDATDFAKCNAALAKFNDGIITSNTQAETKTCVYSVPDKDGKAATISTTVVAGSTNSYTSASGSACTATPILAGNATLLNLKAMEFANSGIVDGADDLSQAMIAFFAKDSSHNMTQYFAEYKAYGDVAPADDAGKASLLSALRVFDTSENNNVAFITDAYSLKTSSNTFVNNTAAFINCIEVVGTQIDYTAE